MRRSALSLGVVPLLQLLIPSPEANEKYTRNFPPFFYRCSNGQVLVSRIEYEDHWERAGCSLCTRTPLMSVRRFCGSRKGGSTSLSVSSSTTANRGGVVTTVLVMPGAFLIQQG